ncbi:MAG: shikimate kinase [Clostridia bacterium]|nr:shikimate kinase [Clostridia bacterium]
MYGLLGEKLGHSFSPQIHARLGDYEYKLFEVAPENLGDFLRSGAFEGLNVTIPYKKAVMPYLAEISENAKAIGSVNTITVLPNGTLRGDNTDYDGFLYLVRQSGVTVNGKKALVLGTGGASLPVKKVLSDLGAREIVSISRTGENNYQNLDKHFDADLIVNTTPVGMYPNNLQSPLSLDGFAHLSGVLDIVYNPQKTKLILDAEQRGIPAFSGLTMLVAQAKRAAELFLQTKIDDRKNDEIYETLSRQMKNIVLVGMPGCGKSTVGKALAKRLSRPFFDADEEIVKRAGKPIPEIFQAEGEAGFRKIETEVLFDLCRQSGAVIATGGGAVTVPKNHDILRQNSLVVFINRDIAVLPTAGRPLSEQNDLHEMFCRRLPLYRAVCDYEVDGNGKIQTVTDRVAEVYTK